MGTMNNYIITSSIPGSKTDFAVLSTLLNICEKTNAQLEVFDCKPNYKKEDSDLVTSDKDLRLNKSLLVSSMQLNVNLIDPISGLESLAAKEGSLIIPFPRHRFKTICRSLKHSKSPRAIWCTGTISEPYYKNTKSGNRMKPYHLKGALFVQIEDNEIFHIRQLTANKDGSIYDLDKLYLPDNTVKSIDIAGIKLGDLHPPYIDNDVKKVTIELLKRYKPKHIFYEDAFDSTTVSHHLEHKHVTKALIPIKSLKEELKLSSDLIQELINCSPNSKHFIVASNHNEHLDRYIDEVRFKEDYINLELAAELLLQKIRYRKGKVKEDSLEFGLKSHNQLSNVKFLTRDDSYSVAGVECGNHGDAGSNGALGNSKSQGLLFNGNAVTAHTHSPEVGIYGNYVVGTMTCLNMPYTNSSGGSSWLNSHVIVYPSGTMTHIHIMKKRK